MCGYPDDVMVAWRTVCVPLFPTGADAAIIVDRNRENTIEFQHLQLEGFANNACTCSADPSNTRAQMHMLAHAFIINARLQD